jgi:hypothetical protein
MSHKVYVRAEITRPGPTVPGTPLDATADAYVELEDESAETLVGSGGSLVSAISPTGPNAYFNSLQLPALLAEIRGATATASRPVQRNLNDVADFIDEQTRTGLLERYVCFVS